MYMLLLNYINKLLNTINTSEMPICIVYIQGYIFCIVSDPFHFNMDPDPAPNPT